MLNKIMLIGRLTREPEIRYTSSNIPVASFTLAVNRNFKNKDGNYEADFINVVAWRKLAELVSGSLNKGSLINVVGRLEVSSFEDKEKQRRYKTEVIAEELNFLEKKTISDNGDKLYQEQDAVDGFNPVDDDDLPF